MQAKLEELNETERDWIAENLEAAHSVLGTTDYTMEDLDRAWAEWRESLDPDDDPNPMINAFGVAFGEHLRGRCGLGWVVATDEEGAELALYRDEGDVLILPPNLVGRRFVAGELDFFAPLAAQFEREIAASGSNDG